MDDYYIDRIPEGALWNHIISKLKNQYVYAIYETFDLSKENFIQLIKSRLLPNLTENKRLKIINRKFLEDNEVILAGSYLLAQILETSFGRTDIDLFMSVDHIEELNKYTRTLMTRASDDPNITIMEKDPKDYLDVVDTVGGVPYKIVEINGMDVVVLNVRPEEVIDYLRRITDFTILRSFYNFKTKTLIIDDMRSIFNRKLVLNHKKYISVKRYSKYSIRGFNYDYLNMTNLLTLINCFFYPVSVVYDGADEISKYIDIVPFYRDLYESYGYANSQPARSGYCEIGCSRNCPLFEYPKSPYVFPILRYIRHDHFISSGYVKKAGVDIGDADGLFNGRGGGVIGNIVHIYNFGLSDRIIDLKSRIEAGEDPYNEIDLSDEK